MITRRREEITKKGFVGRINGENENGGAMVKRGFSFPL